MSATLLQVLIRARELGFLGPGPVLDHLRHAEGMAEAVEAGWQGLPLGGLRVADLGSGGGVPALPLALRWPESQWVLVEANARRARHLEGVLPLLGLDGRVAVRHARAEEVGREGSARGSFDLVTARSFGSPAVVAECGAPLLRVGGVLVVSEPPAGPDRWPVEGLQRLGLHAGGVHPGPPTSRLLWAVTPCDERYPRRVGVPGKRPLF